MRPTRCREAHDLPISTRDYRAVSHFLAPGYGSQRRVGGCGLEPLLPNHRPSADAEQLRESIDQLFSVLQDAEASQRSYLLTGKEAYREAFTNADRTFPDAFERLAASARHEPAGQADLIELRRLVELELSELRQAIALRAAKAPAGSELAASSWGNRHHHGPHS